MDELYVTNFLMTYFTGVTEVNFFDFANQRHVLVHFLDETSWDANLTKEKMQVLAPIFLLDKENLDMMANRDKVETIMFFTASRGAIDQFMQEYTEENRPKYTAEDVKKIKEEEHE
jgi:hypothetical protein